MLQETERSEPALGVTPGAPARQSWSEYLVKNCRMVVVDVGTGVVVMGSHNAGSRSCPDLSSVQ